MGLTIQDIQKEGRAKIFRISEDFLLFLCTAFRSKNPYWQIPAWPELPHDAYISGVYYKPECRSLDFLVFSPYFPPTPRGSQFMVVQVNDFQASITIKNPLLK